MKTQMQMFYEASHNVAMTYQTIEDTLSLLVMVASGVFTYIILTA